MDRGEWALSPVSGTLAGLGVNGSSSKRCADKEEASVSSSVDLTFLASSLSAKIQICLFK